MTLDNDHSGDPNNTDRCQWAGQALAHYSKLKGEVPENEDLRDLLADLMHWCDQTEMDFQHELSMAQMNYDEEKIDVETNS